MPTITDEYGRIVPPPLSLSKRERNFILRLFNLPPNQHIDDTMLANILSKDLANLTSRAHYLSTYGYVGALPILPSILLSQAKEECIDLEYFRWIDTKNDRLCNYVWSVVRAFTKYPSFNETALDIGIPTKNSKYENAIKINLYNLYNLEKLPCNNEHKKDCVISFFDMLDVPANQKFTEVNILKQGWIDVSENRELITWINKDNQSWAWEYIFRHEKNPVWFIDNDRPTNLMDNIITTFDLLNGTPDKRELILKKMKSAWSQKSFRDKNNGKKAVNVVLLESIISMLDTICTKTDRRKNEVITRLIREEYEKTYK